MSKDPENQMSAYVSPVLHCFIFGGRPLFAVVHPYVLWDYWIIDPTDQFEARPLSERNCRQAIQLTRPYPIREWIAPAKTSWRSKARWPPLQSFFFWCKPVAISSHAGFRAIPPSTITSTPERRKEIYLASLGWHPESQFWKAGTEQTRASSAYD